jgi:hypothetical protein
MLFWIYGIFSPTHLKPNIDGCVYSLDQSDVISVSSACSSSACSPAVLAIRCLLKVCHILPSDNMRIISAEHCFGRLYCVLLKCHEQYLPRYYSTIL